MVKNSSHIHFNKNHSLLSQGQLFIVYKDCSSSRACWSGPNGR